jgi:hypothetical protein
MPKPEKGSGSGDVDRHKRAAADSLALLDWCIEYFADNGKPGIARRLARNRNQIQKRLKN